MFTINNRMCIMWDVCMPGNALMKQVISWERKNLRDLMGLTVRCVGAHAVFLGFCRKLSGVDWMLSGR